MKAISTATSIKLIAGAIITCVAAAAVVVTVSPQWVGLARTQHVPALTTDLDDCPDFIFVPCPRQTAMISLPLAGSPFSLTYSSSRVPGQKTDPSIEVRPIGLGGWSLNILHAYDVKNRVLVLGNGNRRKVAASPAKFKGESAWAVPSVEAREIYVFDSEGHHLETLDGLTGAVRHRFQWDKAGLASVTEPGERVTQIRRDATGVPVSIVSALGYPTRVGIRDGWLAALAGPSEYVTKIATTSDGLVTEVQNAVGARTSFRYDRDGRLEAIQGPTGEAASFERTEVNDGYSLKATTGTGRTWTSTVRRERDRLFREFIDSSGRKTTVEVHGNRRVLKTPDGTTYRFNLDADPQWGLAALVPSVEVETPGGRRWKASETRTGAVVNTELAPQTTTRALTVENSTWTVEYEPANRTLTVKEPGGSRRTTSFDEQGRPIRDERAGFAAISYVYDTSGQIKSMTQGTGSDARQWSYERDSSKRTTTVVDPLGNKHTISFDSSGRPTELTTPSGEHYVVERDPLGRLVAFSTPPRTATRWSYRPDNRVETITYPGGTDGLHFTTFSYDRGGAMTAATDADANGIVINRDKSGRPVTIDAGGGLWRLSYDEQTGRAMAYETSDEKVETLYDGSDLIAEVWSGTVSAKIKRERDGQGRIVADDVGDASRVEYRYDTMGRLVQVGQLSQSLDPTTGLVTTERLGTVERTWRYNAFGEVIGNTITANRKTLYDLNVTRDRLGRVIERTERMPNGKVETRSFAYDRANRLASYKDQNGRVTTYTYDANGNLIRESGPGREVRASYDQRDALIELGQTAYTYDAAGQLRSTTSPRGKTIYEYDRAGHLLSATLPSGKKLTYVLDGVGRRIGRKVNGTLVNAYAYADLLRPAAELDANGKVMSRFVYSLPRSIPTYFAQQGHSYLIVTDEPGTPRLIVDAATGKVIEEIESDPWGRIITGQAKHIPFGLAGGLADPDTGLVHFGMRDYDPVSGRWAAQDPFGIAAGDANLYRYANGDPINRIDVTGAVADEAQSQGGGMSGESGISSPGKADPLEGGMSDEVQWELEQNDPYSIPNRITNWLYDYAVKWPWKKAQSEIIKQLPGPKSPSDLLWKGFKGITSIDLLALNLANDCGIHCPENVIAEQEYERQIAKDLEENPWRPTEKNTPNPNWPPIGPPRAEPPASESEARELAEKMIPSTPESPEEWANRQFWKWVLSLGDPHLQTANGLSFDFMAVGEFTALRSESEDMVVQVRHVPYSNSRWVSVTSAVALSVNGDRVTIEYGQDSLILRVNGVRTIPVRMNLPAGGFLVPEAGSYLIGWPDGSLLRVFRNVKGMDLSMHLSSTRKDKVHGLLGPYTGAPAKQLTARNGAVIKPDDITNYQQLYRVYGDSWRITQKESLFDYAPGKSTATYTDRTFPDPNPPNISSAVETAARTICTRAAVPQEAMAGCILDVAVTGEAGFAITTATASRVPPPTLALLERKPTSSEKQATTTQEGTAQSFAIKIGDHVAPDKPAAGAGRIEMAGAEDRYTFTAAPGTLVYLKAEPPCTSEYGNMRIAVHDATDTHIKNGWPCLDLGRTLLEKGGSYTIKVWSDSTEKPTGEYGFTIQPIGADQNFALKIGDHVAPDKPAAGAGRLEMAGAQDRYTFTAAPGTLVYVKAEPPCTSEYGNMRIAVHDATDTHIKNGWPCLDLGRTLLEKGGSYTIKVWSDSTEKPTGDYGFAVLPIAPDHKFTIRIGDHIAPNKPGAGAGRLETPGAEDRYTFTAAPGTLVYVKAEPPCTEEGIRWGIYDATNTPVTYGLTICSDGGRTVLEKGGSYTIRVFGERTGATGDYGFALQPG